MLSVILLFLLNKLKTYKKGSKMSSTPPKNPERNSSKILKPPEEKGNKTPSSTSIKAQSSKKELKETLSTISIPNSKRKSASEPNLRSLSSAQLIPQSESLWSIPERADSSFDEINQFRNNQTQEEYYSESFLNIINKKSRTKSIIKKTAFANVEPTSTHLPTKSRKSIGVNKRISFSSKIDTSIFKDVESEEKTDEDNLTNLNPSESTNKLKPLKSEPSIVIPIQPHISHQWAMNKKSTSNSNTKKDDKPITVLMHNKWKRRGGGLDIQSSETDSDQEVPEKPIKVLKPQSNKSIERTLSSDSDVLGDAEMMMFQTIIKKGDSDYDLQNAHTHPNTIEEEIRKVLFPPGKIKRRNFVAFDSDRESDDVDEVSSDDEKPSRRIELIKYRRKAEFAYRDRQSRNNNNSQVNKSRWCTHLLDFLKPGMRSKITGQMRLGKISQYKIIVTSLKCIQFFIALLWTLFISLCEEHISHFIMGTAYALNSLSLITYLSLYASVKYLGLFHNTFQMWLVYLIMTFSMAHYSAVTNLTTGYVIVPFILGVILLFTICFLAKVYASTKTLKMLRFFEPGMVFLGFLFFAAMCAFTLSISYYIKVDPNFAKTLASCHCGLAAGCLYGVYVIHQIRSFATGGQLTSMGQIKDYAFAAIII